jgi:hypothetical protein
VGGEIPALSVLVGDGDGAGERPEWWCLVIPTSVLLVPTRNTQRWCEERLEEEERNRDGIRKYGGRREKTGEGKRVTGGHGPRQGRASRGDRGHDHPVKSFPAS